MPLSPSIWPLRLFLVFNVICSFVPQHNNHAYHYSSYSCVLVCQAVSCYLYLLGTLQTQLTWYTHYYVFHKIALSVYINKQASNGLWCSAGPFLLRAILTHKVGKSELEFGVQSGFIIRSVYARLQVSCVQRLRLVPPWLTSRHTHRHSDQLTWIAQQAELKTTIAMHAILGVFNCSKQFT